MTTSRTFARHACSLLLAALLSAAAQAGARAQGQDVPGTRVSLQPPAGFSPADRFPGYQHPESSASILVTEMQASFGEVAAGFDSAGLASRGMVLRESRRVPVAGRQGLLLSVSQRAGGTAYEKWIAAFGSESETVLVTATYPQTLAGRLGEPMRRAVLSARWEPGGPADPFAGLGFRVDESARLRVATRMANMLLLTEGGKVPIPGPGAPLLVVGRSVAPVDLRDVEGFSRTRLLQTETISEVSNVSGGPVSIDGAAGYEIVADAVDTRSSTPIRVYQVVLPEGSHYLIVQGLVGADRAAGFVPEFRAVARSLRGTR